jgi:hypothetical protein
VTILPVVKSALPTIQTMILPERIGNGKTHDDDEIEDDETRGASLYLEEAVDVSYSGDGIELPMDEYPGLFVVNPDASDSSNNGENDVCQSNHSLHRTSSHHPRQNSDLSKLLRSSKSNNWKRLRDDETESSSRIDATAGRSSPMDTSSTTSTAANTASIQAKEFIKNRSIGKGHTTTCTSKAYKIDLLRRNVSTSSHDRRATTIGTLKDMGIKVYVLDGRVIPDSFALLRNVKKVVALVARDNYSFSNSRCLLFQDEYGRLFNVILTKHCVGPAQTYQEDLNTYSGFQAMIALAILCRSFPCLMSGMYFKFSFVNFISTLL